MLVSRMTFFLFVLVEEIQALVVGRGKCCSFAGMSGALCALIYFMFERLEAS